MRKKSQHTGYSLLCFIMVFQVFVCFGHSANLAGSEEKHTCDVMNIIILMKLTNFP